MWKKFKEFAFRGNVMDMAVGVVIGTAFSNITKSLVSDIIMPLIGLLTGGIDFTKLSVPFGEGEDAAALTYGNFIQNVVDFFIIASSIFLMVTLIGKIREKFEALINKKHEEEKAAADPSPTEAELLAEIRDLLKNSANE